MLTTFVLVFHLVQQSINRRKDITKEVRGVMAENGRLDGEHAPAQGRGFFGREAVSTFPQTGKSS